MPETVGSEPDSMWLPSDLIVGVQYANDPEHTVYEEYVSICRLCGSLVFSDHAATHRNFHKEVSQ